MECSSGAGLAIVDCTVKKKRSSISRRPRPDLQLLLHTYTSLPLSAQSIDSGNNDGDQYFKDTIVGSDVLGSENKLKLKLKFGGVTHTIQTNSTVEYAPQHRQKQDKDIHCFNASEKGRGNGVRKKDFSKSGSSYVKVHSSRGKAYGDIVSENETYESIRKSKRVPKRRAMDVGFDGDDDDELRYLGRLSAPKVVAGYEDEEVAGIGRERGTYEDKDYVEEEELTSDDEPGSNKKKLEKGLLESFVERRNESTPTTRNRALQSGNEVLSGSGTSLIEFPNGLPPAPPKKQKEKLSEEDQQLKKAEAAQRRRMQSEKAAREAEAEAIRKILGQDSGRKKKEEKMKKQRDVLAQGKASKSDTLASNSVRWIFGPRGTVVIFSEDIGLPSIFNSVPSSYPPPLEKCAGPNCTNAYKYRDSKSKLPLCSLQCYKAIHGKKHPSVTC